MRRHSMFQKVALLLGVPLLTLGGGQTLAAQDDCHVHDRGRGECSPGTQAPSAETMVNVIRGGSPQRLMGTLEYGERVECYECVPLLMERALTDDNARVREFASWWLRRRTFAANMVFRFFKETLTNDGVAQRRARAAEALGEFLDPASLPPLRTAAMGDSEPQVRAAAVSALGRLNHPEGNGVLSAAIADQDGDVRLAAIKAVNRVNFFREFDALMDALGDAETSVRREAALLLGQRRVSEAAPALAAMLRGDSEASVRRSAAWALGRIGGTEARSSLAEAVQSEADNNVRDAIEVAQQMR